MPKLDTIVNVFVLIVSIAALYLAHLALQHQDKSDVDQDVRFEHQLQLLRDQSRSLHRQEPVLNASRSALRSEVAQLESEGRVLAKSVGVSSRQLDAQQHLLDAQQRSLAISSAQLNVLEQNISVSTAVLRSVRAATEAQNVQVKLLTAQSNAELAKQRSNADIKIYVATTKGNVLLTAASAPVVNLIVAPGDSWGRLALIIRNVGDASLSNTIVLAMASPASVFIDKADYRLSTRVNHNMYQEPSFPEIVPYRFGKLDYNVILDVTPNAARQVVLKITILGDNAKNGVPSQYSASLRLNVFVNALAPASASP